MAVYEYLSCLQSVAIFMFPLMPQHILVAKVGSVGSACPGICFIVMAPRWGQPVSEPRRITVLYSPLGKLPTVNNHVSFQFQRA